MKSRQNWEEGLITLFPENEQEMKELDRFGRLYSGESFTLTFNFRTNSIFFKAEKPLPNLRGVAY